MSSCGWSPLSNQQIRAWLDRHPEALPRRLADLVAYPVSFRRVMVNAVSPEVRVALWREHLESFLVADSPLNVPQKEFVAATIPRLSELFAAPAPNPVIVEWERTMADVFPRQDAARVFTSLGPPEPPEGLPLPPDAIPGAARDQL